MFFLTRQSRSAPLPHARDHSAKPKNWRSAKHNMPASSRPSTALASVISLVP